MLVYAQYAVIAALVVTVASAVAYIVAVYRGYQAVNAAPAVRRTTVRVGADDRVDELSQRPEVPASAASAAVSLARVGTGLAATALVLLTVALVIRTLVTGHGPFVTQHEFAVSTAWGFLAVYLFFEWRYRARTLALLLLPVTAGMELYALSWEPTVDPLVPALQNSLLLTTHIIVAIIAYGAFAVSFAAAGLYLAQGWIPEKARRVLPKPEVLDRLGYRAVVIGYPLLTLVIVLGAVWAEIAWGSYWSWDPKETASLVTWLIYGGYLHARVARGWVGRGAAWLLVVAFASVILTFLGNAFFGGLHSYGVTR